ncbi:hypothetical protein BU24DRAFT_4883 [Aaosphaeria arxii CBS 175.79]|uniref:Sin3 binding protein-domain-containing protein n=1 Tax=Aaosphaeria arxii CBS 175.79 TaxID=1450172 RepID=A0A6A5Y4Z9_9PLEO|nr:uncharacterized protein BU24DRAFT_4883 [Aaosphaeria arxii CBS 175.79]KAF2020632.1 hypothetical protein BU24DRAFT_4883 [Aaosphaeria arxii CBS 175.79]
MATFTNSRPVSNIAVAFATHAASSSSTSNMPDAHHMPCDAAIAQPAALLTPPSSISPTLPAHKHRPGMAMTGVPRAPSHVDSDIDLQDAVEHAKAQDLPSSALSREALAGLEAAGQITAAMLAKHHLPKIFMGHGSMPVRDIMSHLAQSVPGYSRIPPAKARRLVVAALEHRAGGGLHGEVVFEKVGWGRWHVKGQHSQSGQGMPIKGHGASRPGLTPPASVDSNGGLAISKLRNGNNGFSGSWAAASMQDDQDEEMADRMSLDGSEDSESETSEMDLEHDLLDDDTDEEDWSAIGPDALRASFRGQRTQSRDYNHLSRMTSARMRTTSGQSLSFSPAGRSTPTFAAVSPPPASRDNAGPLRASSGVMGNTSERAAIEALIAMGSM